MLFRASLTRRDALLRLLGATLMHLFSLAFSTFSSGSIIIKPILDHILTQSLPTIHGIRAGKGRQTSG
ncbi:hypothetical protein BDZ89DRAFT_116255 [Hymenopellis radicata]|nr:hypothetical protein BDZ89DRAFT_116255 [Hymenopellis radicata]